MDGMLSCGKTDENSFNGLAFVEECDEWHAPGFSITPSYVPDICK